MTAVVSQLVQSSPDLIYLVEYVFGVYLAVLVCRI